MWKLAVCSIATYFLRAASRVAVVLGVFICFSWGLTNALLASSPCRAPAPGWYKVHYQRIKGDCKDLPAHRQHFESFSDMCYMNLQVKKSFMMYEAEFNGKITWDVDGTNLRGEGDIKIDNGLTGTKCSGQYKVKLTPVLAN